MPAGKVAATRNQNSFGLAIEILIGIAGAGPQHLAPESQKQQADPGLGEIDQHRRQRPQVQGDVKQQALVFPAQQPGNEDQVRGAADGQKFRRGLHQGQDHRLKQGHGGRLVRDCFGGKQADEVAFAVELQFLRARR